ncbi:hypothetical protein B566_EDAN001034 [Ephemera danica]|nr:hypothetical protein B566_EDAN001034 [Ephemera danica]
MERLVGKHLVSHFHCIQAKKQPELARSLILMHIDRIVRHSPFQCAMCHFYCNTPDNLLLHFASQTHHDMDSKQSGLFWCQQCKVETATSDQMVDHLKSREHNQLALTLNHMVPIIVRKRIKMTCNHCEATFTLNIKLVRHIREMHQLQPDIEPVFSCYHCKYVCSSQRSLQRHELRKHGAKNITGFFCTVCDLVFSSSKEVIKHRRQLECRTKTEQARGVDVSRKCNICNEQCSDLNAMKAHIFANHFGALHRCQKCFEEFAISQDLSRHVRDGKCPAMASDYEQTTEDKALNMRKPEAKCSLARFVCDICDKTYARRRTLTIHFKKGHLQSNKKQNTKPVLRYQCGQCGKLLSKKYLLVHHINTVHSAKSPTVILPCNESSPSSFKRKKSSHEKTAVLTPKKPAVSTPNEKSGMKKKPKFLCNMCDKQFMRRCNLIKHFKLRHHEHQLNTLNQDVTLKCVHCKFTAKRKHRLKRHMITVHLPESRSRDWKCNICHRTFYDKGA